MKNKTKLVLGLSILTAAALTAGATGTFAWFTTNRKATTTFQNITAQSVEGSLTVVMGTLTDAEAKTAGGLADKTTATIESASKMTDVSSRDGVMFARPNWTTTAGNTAENGINGIADVSSLDYGKKGYWTAYYIGLHNGGGKSADVYLDAGSAIKAASEKSADSDAASWTRVAINVANTGETAPQSLAQSGTKVIQGTSAGSKYVAPSATSKTYVEAGVGEDYAPITALNDVVGATDVKTIAAQKIVTIPSNKTQYLTVSVWLEGTAKTAQDSAIGGVVNIQLNFAAVTVAD
jgi:hypothetical protein